MAQEYKYTLVIAHRVQEANHIHIIASHSTKKNDLGKQITINAHRNTDTHTYAKHPPLLSFAYDVGP